MLAVWKHIIYLKDKIQMIIQVHFDLGKFKYSYSDIFLIKKFKQVNDHIPFSSPGWYFIDVFEYWQE